MKINNILTIFLASFALVGCVDKGIKCSDDDVKVLIKRIYTKQIKNQDINESLKKDFNLFNFQEIMLKGMYAKLPKFDYVSSIRTLSYDKDIDLRKCRGTMHFKDGTETIFSYTVQINEENSEQFYVELDTEFLQPLLMKNMFKNILDDNKTK